MFIESLHRNWPSFYSPYFLPFCDFTWLPPKNPFATLPLENLDEALRCFELLHQDSLHHHIRLILLRVDLYQSDHLIIHDSLTYLVIPHINVLRPLVIPVIEMNRTLTVGRSLLPCCLLVLLCIARWTGQSTGASVWAVDER